MPRQFCFYRLWGRDYKSIDSSNLRVLILPQRRTDALTRIFENILDIHKLAARILVPKEFHFNFWRIMCTVLGDDVNNTTGEKYCWLPKHPFLSPNLFPPQHRSMRRVFFIPREPVPIPKVIRIVKWNLYSLKAFKVNTQGPGLT